MRVAVGDELEPCQPANILAEIQAQHGRPCPRIELLPANWIPWDLFSLIIRDDARAMFIPLFQALTLGQDRDARARLIRRVLFTLNDPEVHEIMHPDPKR
jgi:hypothetical protein